MKLIAPLILLLLLVLVVGGAAVTVYYVSATSSISSPTLSNQSSNSSQQIQALKSSPLYKSLSNQQLINIPSIAQAQNASSPSINYNYTYTGSAAYIASIGGLSIPLTIPLQITNLRYYNDSKMAISVTNLPIIGSYNASIVKIKNSLYTCTPQNPYAQGQINCYQGSPLSSVSSLPTLNLFYLAGATLNLTASRVYPSTYKGIPCVYLNSSFTLPRSSLASLSSQLSYANSYTHLGPLTLAYGTIQSCIVPSSNLPLTVSLNMMLVGTNSTSKLVVVLTQSASGQVGDSQITTLPGPTH